MRQQENYVRYARAYRKKATNGNDILVTTLEIGFLGKIVTITNFPIRGGQSTTYVKFVAPNRESTVLREVNVTTWRHKNQYQGFFHFNIDLGDFGDLIYIIPIPAEDQHYTKAVIKFVEPPEEEDL